MHHALQIQEILLNIFQYSDARKDASDLIALARTCRTFKEPALDILWEQLDHLSPIAQCLPDASHRASRNRYYSFHRSLTRIEWDMLQSYTRRIPSISIEGVLGLSQKSLISLSKSPTGDLFFPNVRHLCFEYTRKLGKSLLLLPFPSLISLEIQLRDPRYFENSLKLFSKTSPSLRSLSIEEYYVGMHMNIDPSLICQWQNLQTIDCSQISLDVITLVHLSRQPPLTHLAFTLPSTLPLPDQISLSDSPLTFTNLEGLKLCSEFLDPISRLLSRTRLPAVTYFLAFIESHPSGQHLSSFFDSVRTASINHTVRELRLVQSFNPGRAYVLWNKPVLGFGDLQGCMAFSNLRCINLNIEWGIGLRDRELLTLVSAWPHLQEFSINKQWGWNVQGGITPNGVLQLLQTCPSLNRIALAIDTRGYIEIPPSPASLGLAFLRVSIIDVLDSFIEEESVPAISAFFAGFMPHLDDFKFSARQNVYRYGCEDRWDNVRKHVNEVKRSCCNM